MGCGGEEDRGDHPSGRRVCQTDFENGSGRGAVEEKLLGTLPEMCIRDRYEGEKRIEIKTSPLYREAVARVQKALQRKVVDYGVAIETNPSSNYLIGTFTRYDKHPIIQFYNRNLTTDEEELSECPQLCVSINTDDIGVFSVSLENEYAYMALALEKARNEKGSPRYNKNMIYQWLDDIREMGVDQTFLSSEKLVKARKTWEEQQISK